MENATSNKKLVVEALEKHELRYDGRTPTVTRPLAVTLSRFEGAATAEFSAGRTRVLAHVAAELVAPFPDRPAEGMLNFNVEFSPMASAAFEPGRPSAEAVELTRIVERGVRDSQALDTEALCVVAGERVWSIRVDAHVLDHDGNLIDATVAACMAALQHFRRPEVSVVQHGDGEQVLSGGAGGGGSGDAAPNASSAGTGQEEIWDVAGTSARTSATTPLFPPPPPP